MGEPVELSDGTAEAVIAALASPETWQPYSREQKEALLGLAYHAIDDLGSGFEASHAKVVLDLLVSLSRARP